ncbi:predicted protein [Lichtheimia corymbifera JMRC:FSU:9682]|uniref:BLOC-1-related complex subunit 7 n=1 Tax=Lichtheimia corymbifera JMRC:FSU:9682 TaxID=1263082 RepID=A0A068RSB0_9FUNG|nr:predicted protein [Lichtheimia corymbifera JMRC:FSU:9682]
MPVSPPVPSPSSSSLSFKSIERDECHSRADKTMDEWSDCLKMMLKYSDPRDDFQKTLKRFTQVDGHAKNTKQALEKANQALDQLLEKRQGILGSIKTLQETQRKLELQHPIIKTTIDS